MVYLEPSILGLQPFINCWLFTIPPAVEDQKDKLKQLFEDFLQPSISFMRENCKEFAPTMDSSLAFSLTKLLDCFFAPFMPKEGHTIPSEHIELIPQLIEPWFFFSLVWSVGGTCDGESRKKFSDFIRDIMKQKQVEMQFPDEDLVYDYKLEDGGVSAAKSDDDDDEGVEHEIGWVSWMKGVSMPNIVPETRFSDIIVPTLDLVRGSFLVNLLTTNAKKILCVGPTGSGKTLCVANRLLTGMPEKYVANFVTFSARTSANQTQDIIDGKLDKRRKGIFGPPLGKKFVLFIDDLNMPALEVYGAQPPIELLRQYCDHHGWYDRKAIGAFRELVDINLLCAMGPPGGGRNPITARFKRHFNMLSFCEMEDASKQKIFSVILQSWIRDCPNDDVKGLCELVVKNTIDVYNTITTQLLPTPAKIHYTFNLRDLSKVFQGILMAKPDKIENEAEIIRLWYHENCRIFQDRLERRGSSVVH
jgi:dynein heavy chain